MDIDEPEFVQELVMLRAGETYILPKNAVSIEVPSVPPMTDAEKERVLALMKRQGDDWRKLARKILKHAPTADASELKALRAAAEALHTIHEGERASM
jgi:hypothetical protein